MRQFFRQLWCAIRYGHVPADDDFGRPGSHICLRCGKIYGAPPMRRKPPP